jgi:peptide/nickel transport system permease protein
MPRRSDSTSFSKAPWYLRGSVVTLVALHFAALFAGFLAPYSYREQHRSYPLAPPMPPHFVDTAGSVHARPFVYPIEWRDGGTYVEDRSRTLPLRFFVRGPSYSFLGLFDLDVHLFGVDGDEPIFLLGADSLGRDYLSRLVYGGQISLSAGLVGAALAIGVAVLLGGVAGYYGGVFDTAVMRAADLFLSLPWIYVLLAARAFLPLDLPPATAFLVIVGLLGALGWAGPARVVRGVVATTASSEFVTAARGAGGSHGHVLFRHVLPSARSVVLTQGAILVPAYMLAEVTLSFLGLGVSEPVPSWGNMLAAFHQDGLLTLRLRLLSPAACMVAIAWLYHTAARKSDPLASRQQELWSTA